MSDFKCDHPNQEVFAIIRKNKFGQDVYEGLEFTEQEAQDHAQLVRDLSQEEVWIGKTTRGDYMMLKALSPS